jgi:hypothetical protein
MASQRAFQQLYQDEQRNRLNFLRTEIDVCLTLIKLAETRLQMGNRETAERSLAEAEKAYFTLVRSF